MNSSKEIKVYASSRRPFARPLRALIGCLVALALVGLYDPSAPVPAAAAPGEVCFPEVTGKCTSGRFLEYWEANGGLAQQGYPITDIYDEVNPTDGKVYKTQYFERARFEYHPENDRPYDVLLGLVGREQFQKKYPQGAPQGIPPDTGCTPQALPAGTKCIHQRFGQYYLGHGGLAQQGYAISDAFQETSPTNGQTYLVQYFERARFEYHPEYAGGPYEILLGLLAREEYVAKDPAALRFRTVYSDDFADTTRWPVCCPGTTTSAYENGRYVLRATGSTLGNGTSFVDNHVALQGVPEAGGVRPLDEMRLAVDATPRAAGGSSYGLSCRTAGPNVRYTGTVSMLFPPQGPQFGATITLYPKSGPAKTLVTQPLPAGTVALDQTARLQFTCAGPNLTLAIDGKVVARVQDYTLPSGGFGLEAVDVAGGGGTGASSGLIIAYDNLVVDSWR